MLVFNRAFQTLEYGLDYAATRNERLSQNIANVDTPHYKRSDISFEDILNKEITQVRGGKRTDSRHIPFKSQIHTEKIKDSRYLHYNHNGNNVDMDKEMAILAKNQMYQQAMVDRLNGKFRDIQTVLRGGN